MPPFSLFCLKYKAFSRGKLIVFRTIVYPYLNYVECLSRYLLDISSKRILLIVEVFLQKYIILHSAIYSHFFPIKMRAKPANCFPRKYVQ